MATEKKNHTIRLFVILALLSLLLIGLDYQNWLNWPKARVEILLAPLQKQVYSWQRSVEEWRSFLSLSRKRKMLVLERENDSLHQKVAHLTTENKRLKEENQKMKDLLQVLLPPEWEFLPAQVLSYNEQELLVGAGRKSGVKKRMIVVLGKIEEKKGVLVGQVVRANPRNSLVRLPNHPQSRIPVQLVDGGEGLLNGQVTGDLLLEKVLQEVDLKKNDFLVTSGKNGNLPADLLIGEVESVNKDESEVYQSAHIKPLLSYKQLETVFIVAEDQFGGSQ